MDNATNDARPAPFIAAASRAMSDLVDAIANVYVTQLPKPDSYQEGADYPEPVWTHGTWSTSAYASDPVNGDEPRVMFSINGKRRTISADTAGAIGRMLLAAERAARRFAAAPSHSSCDGASNCSATEHEHGCFSDDPCTHEGGDGPCHD